LENAGFVRLGDKGIALAGVHHKPGQLCGFEFMEISLEPFGVIEENGTKSDAATCGRAA
jgi:hypothetical protein